MNNFTQYLPWRSTDFVLEEPEKKLLPSLLSTAAEIDENNKNTNADKHFSRETLDEERERERI